MADDNTAAFRAACDEWAVRVRESGGARAEQDKVLLGWSLDPEVDYSHKAAEWRDGYRAAAARLTAVRR